VLEGVVVVAAAAEGLVEAPREAGVVAVAEARAVEVREAVVRVAQVQVEVREAAVKAALAAAREAALAVAVLILPLTITIRPTTSRGQSCRHSHLRLRPTNKSWRRWRKERAASRFSTHNDLLGGLERIGREQNEFYILGYVPGDTPEGSCHTLKVKLNRGGLNVRARSGYCNTRSANVLEGKPLEKQLESHAMGSQLGSIHGVLQAPYFYTAPETARVNLAMEIPADTFQFNKDKGKYHANLNVLGIAYRTDGTVGARFSDTVNLDLEKDEWKEFTKSPYRYENQFDATPGTYRLTVVLSAGGDAFGKFESPLAIDPYDGKHFSLSGVALTNSAQRVNEIPTGLDSVLLEDRTPLVVKGLQIVPSGSNRFKHTDNVILYTEIYEPLLTSATPPNVGMGYRIFERSTNKQVFFTEVIRAEDFIQKGNSVIPIGLKVKVDDLKPGSYRLMMQAVDSAKNHAPDRIVDFDVME